MKTAIAILTLTFFTFSCKDKENSSSTKSEQIIGLDSLTNTETKASQPTIDLIYETGNLKLFGDTTIEEAKISSASIKFEPYIGFNDFSVAAIDHKKYAELDLKSNRVANSYRTRLREGYKSDTANFGGHYTFIYFGCGSPCQGSLLIDRKTGKVYDSPGASGGYDYQVDSRMLIVNPPDTNGFYHDCPYCKPIIYIFNEQTKSFEERLRK
tara:strand:+ start:1997 stop:2629 length:633 start_codon:yes stop_codon:yes gene_type:complete